MAMMDDRSFLISHIRQSFITSDDTGMCEVIIEPDEEQRQQDNQQQNATVKNTRPTTWHAGVTKDDNAIDPTSLTDSGVDSDTELSHSPDIIPDMDFASHRRRSNTAQRLESLRKEKHKQSQIKHVQWKKPDLPNEKFGELFERKTVPEETKVEAGTTPKRVSALSLQLEQFSNAPSNPFVEYARFSGRASGGQPTKKLAIYLTMLQGEQRSYPMIVDTVTTAKIQELIGLICWQYINEGYKPTLHRDSADHFTLHIAEDDGEVDLDFPALDNGEPVSKFGFTKLALVEKEMEKVPKASIVVTINMPNRGFSKIPLDSDDILMRDLVDQVLTRRHLKQDIGLEYQLEKQSEHGVIIDLDKPLSAMSTMDFCLVRENSVRGDLEVDGAAEEISDMARSLCSHQYSTYKVTMIAKLGRKIEVQLGISGEKIEIDPVSSKGLFLKQKASTYDTEDIASCHLLEDKAAAKLGKATFRLVYHCGGGDFRHHDFECSTDKAFDIVRKVCSISEMRSGVVRKEYLAHKQQQQNKRLMLNLFKRASNPL